MSCIAEVSHECPAKLMSRVKYASEPVMASLNHSFHKQGIPDRLVRFSCKHIAAINYIQSCHSSRLGTAEQDLFMHSQQHNAPQPTVAEHNSN